MLKQSMLCAPALPKSIPNDYKVKFIGKANGTFGELLQGVLPGEEHFLVTMPISCYSQCIIVPDQTSSTLNVYPKHKTKSLKLAKLILKHFKVCLTGTLFLSSELDEGKGLASSSADLVATARAFSQLLNQDIDLDLLQQFLKLVEPTDGVMFDGCVAYYHRKVQLLNFIGYLPMLSIIAIDEGGAIDTIQYNTVKRSYFKQEIETYEILLSELPLAIKTSDLTRIGSIATQSALMNQRHNPKRHLQSIIDICEKINGLGVIIAHSGTYIGLLLNRCDTEFEIKVGKAVYLLSRLSTHIKIYETLNFNIVDSTNNVASHKSMSLQIQV